MFVWKAQVAGDGAVDIAQYGKEDRNMPATVKTLQDGSGNISSDFVQKQDKELAETDKF
jgi:hypothetical protein